MKKFNSRLNGYDKDEVNAFVKEIATNYEEMLNSLKQRDKDIDNLKERLTHYQNMESTLNRALLVAEDASNQIKRIANEESKIILEDAKKNADRIINTALLKAEKCDEEAENMKRKIGTYKRRLKQALEEQLEMLDEFDKINI